MPIPVGQSLAHALSQMSLAWPGFPDPFELPFLESAGHALGIHGPQVRHVLTFTVAAVYLGLAAFGGRWWLSRRLTASSWLMSGGAAIALLTLVVVAASLISQPQQARRAYNARNAAWATPPGADLPTAVVRAGGLAQATGLACISTPKQRLTLPRPVGRDSTLVLVFAGQGYLGPAPELVQVHDSLDGIWSRLATSGPGSADGRHWIVLSVMTRTAGRAGRVDLTLETRPGQSGASVVVFELAGAPLAPPAAARSTRLRSGPAGIALAPTPAPDPGALLDLTAFAAYTAEERAPVLVGWAEIVRADGGPNCGFALAAARPATPGAPGAALTNLPPDLEGYAATVISFGAQRSR